METRFCAQQLNGVRIVNETQKIEYDAKMALLPKELQESYQGYFTGKHAEDIRNEAIIKLDKDFREHGFPATGYVFRGQQCKQNLRDRDPEEYKKRERQDYDTESAWIKDPKNKKMALGH